MKQFDFGQNWLEFSTQALNTEKVRQAKQDFATLFQGIQVKNKRFLDIGFGQGLSLLTAREMGAIAVGNDINPKCHQALKRNRKFFTQRDLSDIPIVVGSILDAGVVERLKECSPDQSGFDIVHSWGVLHHTGEMWVAIGNAISLVAPEGVFMLAIYDRHWTAPIWHMIKRIYMKAPNAFKKMMLYGIGSIQFLGAWLTMGKKPSLKGRGMDFWYDQIDWLGGYPYEYASEKEIVEFFEERHFKLIKFIPSQGWTGTVEYAFRKIG